MILLILSPLSGWGKLIPRSKNVFWENIEIGVPINREGRIIGREISGAGLYARVFEFGEAEFKLEIGLVSGGTDGAFASQISTFKKAMKVFRNCAIVLESLERKGVNLTEDVKAFLRLNY